MNPICQVIVSNASGEKRLSSVGAFPMKPAAGSPWAVTIDPTQTDQEILGFGGIWTDTDVHMLLTMSPAKQEEVLHALFDRETGAGWSFMRLPFGSTDWEVTTDYYTYDDVPYGEYDWELKNFSIQRDIDRGLFDLARRCKAINPELQFLGSVWGVPAWMKENHSIMFGRFNPECTEVYARYLRKTIEAYREQGIELLAVTPQNESLTSDDRATPACRFTWRLQRDVVLALKKELADAGLSTEVWVFDHNFDLSAAFVDPMLADPEAYAAIDGVAFHDYGGSPAVMGDLHRRYPDMSFYMTERNIRTVWEMERLIQHLRNGGRSYIQWSVLTDEYGGPHQFLGNPFRYHRPLKPEDLAILYNHKENPDDWRYAPGYGLYGQFTKFIRPGMRLIASTPGHVKWVSNVAFLDPKDGSIVTLLVNQTSMAQPVSLHCSGWQTDLILEPMTVASCLISPCEAAGAADLSPVFSFPTFEEEPAWDIAPQEILMKGEAKEREEILFGCRVKNVGELPTPEGASLFVSYFLDGDDRIGRSIDLCPVLAPGEEVTVWVNVPVGLKRTWTAEGGWHNIFVHADLGSCTPEANGDNNHFGSEFFFTPGK